MNKEIEELRSGKGLGPAKVSKDLQLIKRAGCNRMEQHVLVFSSPTLRRILIGVILSMQGLAILIVMLSRLARLIGLRSLFTHPAPG